MNESLDNCGNDQEFSFKYQWIVRSFVHHCSEFPIMSPEFIYQYNENVKTKMKIILYPYGKDKSSDMALYLASMNNFEISVKCSFYFSNMNIEACIMTMENQKFKPNDIKGASIGIKRNDIVDLIWNSNCNLKIVCEMYKTNDVDILNSIKFKTLNDFDKLLKNPDFCDVTIKAGGKLFQVHKAILCARSIVFEKMFKIDMKEKKENLLEIEDINHEIIEEMLKFIYTGEVNNLEKNAGDLLVAADKYALKGLIDICIYKLGQCIKLDDAVNLLLLADRHNLELIKMKAINFISDNVENIIKKPEFKLLENSPKLLVELYSHLAEHRIENDSIKTEEDSKLELLLKLFSMFSFLLNKN